MGDRIIEISGAASRLSVRNRQLVVAQEDASSTPLERQVPIEDLALLILDRSDISLTQPVLTQLAEAGAALAICGRDHHPAALSLPMAAHWAGTEVALAQIEAPRTLTKRLWQTLIRSKIRQQGAVLALGGKEAARFKTLAREVKSGDPENREAQAAQVYWPALLGKDFRRRRDGDPPNNLLNYGYAILRAAMARAIVGAGLLPVLGLHHRGRGNPFCLADDLMEPYRPLIDLRVVELVEGGMGDALDLDRNLKQALISVMHERVRLKGPSHDGKALSVLQACQATAVSLATAFRDAPGPNPGLTLPLPVSGGGFVSDPELDFDSEGP